MAKKKKPGPSSESQPPSQPTSVKSGLLGIMLPAILGSALVIALCGALAVFMVLQPGAQQQLALLGQGEAQAYVDDMVQLARTTSNHVQQAAGSNLVKSALQGDASAISQTATELKSFFPYASHILITPRGDAKKNPDSEPPVSFPQLDMIARAEKNDPLQPEIHLHDKKAFLTIVQPVLNGKRAIGTLLVSYDLAPLRKLLPEVPAERGYVELIQTFANKPQVVYSLGNRQHKQGEGYSAKGAVEHWSARFYPAAASNVIGSGMTMIWVLFGIGLVLALILTGASYMLLNSALQNNATALASFFQAQIQHDKPTKPFTLGIFASLAQTLQRMFEDYDRKARQALNKARDHQQPAAAKKTATPQDALPDFDPTYHQNDVLDVDIHEDDHDLLSGAASANSPLEMNSMPADTGADSLDLDDMGLDDMGLDDMEMAEPEMVREDITLSPTLFRAYDIRGTVGDTLDRDVAYAIGSAIGSEAADHRQDTIIIGRDGRHSSPELAEALAQGIQSTGVNVIDIGAVPTPVLYYATKTLQTQSGVMVTGSHNPPEYNGFKIVINDEPLSGKRIQALKDRVDEKRLHKGHGRYEAQEITRDYLERVCSDVVLAKPMRIVVDSGNGIAGPLACQLLDALGCSVSQLYTEVDGNFPNHHPDPSNPDNLQDLIQSVADRDAEIGIAFDGDGDRLGIVTRSGKIIWPDRILMLYARDLLSRNPGADILYDVKCTRDVAEMVSSLGGRAILCATGHSLMKAKMRETGAVVGGELSGHIFFNDRWFGFDDALYSAARLLEILSMEPFDADTVFAEFPEKPCTPELHIPVSEADKFKIMEKLESQANFDGGNLVKVDGVRVDFPDSWGLVRASNTTPVLVARFEGDSEAALEQVKSVFREQLLAVEPGLNISF